MEKISKNTRYSVMIAISILIGVIIVSVAFNISRQHLDKEAPVVVVELSPDSQDEYEKFLLNEQAESQNEFHGEGSEIYLSNEVSTSNGTRVNDGVNGTIPKNSKYSVSEYAGHYDFTFEDDSGDSNVYRSLTPDANTFEYLNEDYVKDSKNVFYRGLIAQGVKPENCTKENIGGCDPNSWKIEIEPYNLEITWLQDKLPASGVIQKNQCVTDAYLAGVVNNGKLKNSSIYVESDEICGMWCGGFAQLNSRHYVTLGDSIIPVEDGGFSISGVTDFPKEVAIPRSELKLLSLGSGGFSDPSYKIEDTRFLFSDKGAGAIYDIGGGNYRSKRSDHIEMGYELEFPFFTEKGGGILDVTFKDGVKNEEAYSLNGGYGENFRLVDKEEYPDFENRITPVGSFPNGDEVFKISNEQDFILRNLYNDGNTLASYDGGKNKYTYEEFISHKPYLYWKNPFDDWVEMLNQRYERAAEKCKPVIYLYPEEKGDFEVYVEPNGGFTETIPEYGNGWYVTATPDSQITDKKTGEVYDYLYWEGINTGIPEITEGWIVPVEDIEQFLVEKLTKLGLKGKEITDFNEYWIDRLQKEGASEYKIMFLPQPQFDEMSPLTVTGDETPNSVIRVMMYAQAAKPGETLLEQQLPQTPEREGFMVVEWGGAVFN